MKIAKEKERNLNIKIIGEQDKEKIENHNKNEEIVVGKFIDYFKKNKFFF